MTLSLLWTAFFMGLVGGPHCLAMCAAPCQVVIEGHRKAVKIHTLPAATDLAPHPLHWSAVQFHVGRLLGYSALGATAAFTFEKLAWFSDQTSLLHPVWVFMHLAILAWGFLMLFQGQQPAWLERAGRSAWRRIQPALSIRAGSVLAGMLWALMPCGLLYSAVLVAALSGALWSGAASMMAFAAGSALWLICAPLAWRWVNAKVTTLRAGWGTRAAGGMLIAVALWALWMDLVYKPSLWCR